MPLFSCSLRKLDVGSMDSSIAMACCGQQRLANLVAFAGTFMKVNMYSEAAIRTSTYNYIYFGPRE